MEDVLRPSEQKVREILYRQAAMKHAGEDQLNDAKDRAFRRLSAEIDLMAAPATRMTPAGTSATTPLRNLDGALNFCKATTKRRTQSLLR
jgi:hypothetical protein